MSRIFHLLQGIGAALVLLGMIYFQYRRAKWASDEKDQKADVQTLFSGKK